MSTATATPLTHGPADGEHIRFEGGLGTRRMAPGVVEHDLPARRLGSPMHVHTNEDEWSYVLSGRLSAQVGEVVVEAGPGELVLKPRDIPHAFWNAGDGPVRFLEIMHPAGFEEYFFALAAPLAAGDFPAMGAVIERFGVQVDVESIPGLVAAHGLDG